MSVASRIRTVTGLSAAEPQCGRMDSVSDLIDTTEMYLRTVFELEEEGVVPLRARIAERLGQSGPTVSQTVARMERDGLISVEGDRHLELSPHGRTWRPGSCASTGSPSACSCR